LNWKKREAIIRKQNKLFDAIEHSWFYSSLLNPNKKAQQVAKSLHIPFIATSDTHFIEHCTLGLTNVLSDSNQIEDIFHAIRN
jgi:predicted metal-dependent phosphoesterase TrpH